MAKDPAVLFYTSDFLTGTALMNMTQRGRYITLLCLQHQQGHLSEEDMLEICGGQDRKVFAKFEKDENGFYYNKRMDEEGKKRREYAQSRSENGKKGGRPKNHMESETKASENHMETICLPYEKHTENENINVNSNIPSKSNNPNNSSNSNNNNCTTVEESVVCSSVVVNSNNTHTDTPAHAREKTVDNLTPPSRDVVIDYFKKIGVLDAETEADKFITYNTRLGWKCLPVWVNSADNWISRITEKKGSRRQADNSGLAKSFDTGDFFAAAVKKAYGGDK